MKQSTLNRWYTQYWETIFYVSTLNDCYRYAEANEFQTAAIKLKIYCYKLANRDVATCGTKGLYK